MATGLFNRFKSLPIVLGPTLSDHKGLDLCTYSVNPAFTH
jgi:hypothetical protein